MIEMCYHGSTMGFFDWTTDCISRPPTNFNEILGMALLVGIAVGLTYKFIKNQIKEG